MPLNEKFKIPNPEPEAPCSFASFLHAGSLAILKNQSRREGEGKKINQRVSQMAIICVLVFDL
jgi:hypothetical protein